MKPQAVVIGTGFGGLAAAVRLLARGYRVRVLEALNTVGGRARVFERGPFRFDAGPTVITAPYLFDELFACLGRRREDYVEFLPVDPFYRCKFADGESFDYVGDDERLIAEIERLSPKDVDGYKKLVVHAERIFDIGYTELADQPFSRLSDMLRIVPDLARLSAYRSVYSLVERYIEDERLRQVLTFEPLLVGGNPMKVPGIYLLIHWLERKWGVHFARGGTGAIVQALVRLIEEAGGEIETGAPVEQILVRDGAVVGVRLDGGREINADIVVSNADPTLVYGHMIDRKQLGFRRAERALKKRQSMSLFVGYFATNRLFEDTRHHTILLGPRYQGLLRDIFDKKTLANDFSLYLHRPTATDRSMAPEGHDVFYVLSPVPNQKSGLAWEDVAEPYFEAIFDELERRELPGLREAVVEKFSVDPRYFQSELRSMDGAAFGLEPVLHQSAYFRYHNACPDVSGLFFVGASTHPGAGIPGVLCSAKVLERVLPAGGRLAGDRAHASEGAA